MKFLFKKICNQSVSNFGNAKLSKLLNNGPFELLTNKTTSALVTFPLVQGSYLAGENDSLPFIYTAYY